MVGKGSQVLDGAKVSRHAALAPGSLLSMGKGWALFSCLKAYLLVYSALVFILSGAMQFCLILLFVSSGPFWSAVGWCSCSLF